MKSCILLTTLCCALVVVNGHWRVRRDVSGSLDIVTNNAQPIHADVKPEKPIITEKVTPPKSDSLYQTSLRKSLQPATTKLDLIRSLNRIFSLFVLAITAIIEFYPTLAHLFSTVLNFMTE